MRFSMVFRKLITHDGYKTVIVNLIARIKKGEGVVVVVKEEEE